ncbi:phosphotransferase family protein [Amycolatopsis anabasis]|uniref:phosphotransferase family protein n=1 Tax=Amycolatopsis anabasis TaxID=1840409 RepID=UPI00131DA710|nr:aminoglycoside phosphotransferase family protein [Amycolatopsis anabasis]
MAIGSVRYLGRGSTTLHAIDAEAATVAETEEFVLRRFHDTERIVRDPWYRPANEAVALRLLAETEVPAPELVGIDLTPQTCDVPALLTTRIPGDTEDVPDDLDRFLGQLADMLATIHEVEIDPGDPLAPQPYDTYYDPAIDGEREVPRWSAKPVVWEKVFTILDGPPPRDTVRGADGFLHRDFHPDQVLWRDGILTGVVDWTTGCIGPHGIDLARMRINLVQQYDIGVADRFLAGYRSASGQDRHHPYWDLLDAADSVLDEVEPETADDHVAWQHFENWVERALLSL